MKWSLMIGRFWGTEVRLHASMLLLIPYAVLMFKPVGWEQTIKMLLLLAATFVCVALHEMGHTMVARMLGISVTSIVLWPLGGFANLSRRPTKTLDDILITAAGPFVNLLIFFVLVIPLLVGFILYVWQVAPTVEWQNAIFEGITFLITLIIVNLSLVVFNLLPVYPLDGGQITRALIKAAFGEKRADQVMLILSLPPALGLVALGFVLSDPIVILSGLLLVVAAISLNPRMTHWLFLGWLWVFDRGAYYLRRQDFDPALAFFNRAIERRPSAPGLYVNRAVCHMNLLDLSAAKRDAHRALELDEKNFVAWALLGELLSLNKDYPGAQAAYDKALALHPNWAILYMDRGGLYQKQGMFDQAMAELNHAVDLPSGVGLGHFLRSRLLYQMGEVEKARADYQQAFRFAPHWMLAFPEMFLVNFADHLEWAMDYYSRAIEQMPGAYQAYQGRADAARINGRMEWAAADYTRAIALTPKQAELYLGRAKAYLALGNPAQAADDLQQAVRLADRSQIRRQAQELLGTISPVQPEAATPPAQ